MSKSFLRVMAGSLAVQVHQTLTLVNTGIGSISVCDVATSEALQALEYEEVKIVKDALFSIMPGHALKLKPGTYDVDFNDSVSASAIAFVETSESKAAKKEPAVSLANE